MIKLFVIQDKNGQMYERKVLEQQVTYNRVIPEKRGEILDRNGNILASSVKVYNLILDPKVLTSCQDKIQTNTINSLTKYFGIENKYLKEIIQNNKNSNYVILKKGLEYEKIKEFYDLMNDKKSKITINGVWFEEEYVRKYPNNDLAAHVLGFLNSESRGIWGIERYYNNELSGIAGREYGTIKDGLYVEREKKIQQNGNNVILTIDQTIQHYTEEALKNFNNEYGSKNACAIVMNPNNGEILAVANMPNYDLNNPYDLSNILSDNELKKLSSKEKTEILNSIWRNFAVNDTYEPGSTFKPVTIAAGLEEHILTGEETFYCDGFEVVSGRRISCHKAEGHGMQTLGQALANSCNDALMQIGKKIGSSVLCEYQRSFGFGELTNIELPGEVSAENLLYTADRMGPVELATNSFGQSFNVTPIQLIRAFSALVNGGDLYEPHVVKQVITENGEVIENTEREIVRKVISKKTSDTIKKYLFQTVMEGTGQKAQIQGIDIGGKTGQAEKLPRGNGKYVISFIGFAPVEDPQLVTLVVIDEPNVGIVHSSYATSVFAKIMEKCLPYIHIYPRK